MPDELGVDVPIRHPGCTKATTRKARSEIEGSLRAPKFPSLIKAENFSKDMPSQDELPTMSLAELSR
jgi:hypothetical protein